MLLELVSPLGKDFNQPTLAVTKSSEILKSCPVHNDKMGEIHRTQFLEHN